MDNMEAISIIHELPIMRASRIYRHKGEVVEALERGIAALENQELLKGWIEANSDSDTTLSGSELESILKKFLAE